MAGTGSQFRMVRDWFPPPDNPRNLQLEIFSTRNYMLLIGDQLFVTAEIILVWICQTQPDGQVRVYNLSEAGIFLSEIVNIGAHYGKLLTS